MVSSIVTSLIFYCCMVKRSGVDICGENSSGSRLPVPRTTMIICRQAPFGAYSPSRTIMPSLRYHVP